MGIIFHIDVNSAFLSWSALDILAKDKKARDVREIEAIVGTLDGTRRGVVLSKSIKAKKLNIKVGESVAKVVSRYPDIVVVEPDKDSYEKHSEDFIRILMEYTDKVEQASIDEAYMDVTELIDINNVQSILELACKIKKQIKSELGFTVNIGISVNKLLAKMASDFEKPDKVHTLFKFEMEDKMYPLSISALYGCGRATVERLKRLNVSTIGDVLSVSLTDLQGLLGSKTGQYIYKAVRGEGDTEVKVCRDAAKSYSRERTTEEDLYFKDYGKVREIICNIASELEKTLKADNRQSGTVVLLLKDTEFNRHSKQTSLKKPVMDKKTIEVNALRLYSELSKEIFDRGLGIRLIGIRLTNINIGEYYQYTMDDYLEFLK